MVNTVMVNKGFNNPGYPKLSIKKNIRNRLYFKFIRISRIYKLAESGLTGVYCIWARALLTSRFCNL